MITNVWSYKTRHTGFSFPEQCDHSMRGPAPALSRQARRPYARRARVVKSNTGVTRWVWILGPPYREIAAARSLNICIRLIRLDRTVETRQRYWSTLTSLSELHDRHGLGLRYPRAAARQASDDLLRRRGQQRVGGFVAARSVRTAVTRSATSCGRRCSPPPSLLRSSSSDTSSTQARALTSVGSARSAHASRHRSSSLLPPSPVADNGGCRRSGAPATTTPKYSW